ncbi:MAG: hypothetical protein HOP28_14550 [Gemmatimonadales bacterium]|nr:hypothetical protein [Gemmatimonadales bacterium]
MGEAKEWGKAIGNFIKSGGTRTGPSQAEKERQEKEREERKERDKND